MSMNYTMPGLDVVHFGPGEVMFPGSDLLSKLTESLAWRSETITMFGRTMLQPRLIAFYADAGLEYRYSRKTYTGLAWTPLLGILREMAQTIAQGPLNSVLANLYRDGNDSMGMHADDEPELGLEPVIVSMSFGATRRFVMKHRTRKDLPAVEIPLEDTSVLLMRGATQHYWVHGIKKETRPVGPRVNLTFRRIVAPLSGTHPEENRAELL